MALFTGCVAAWELDDLTDATDRGNTLTNNNSATFNTGKIGNAVYVASASSQYLSKASSADVEMGDIDFTIGCWAYASSLGATAKHIILGKDASGQREYYLHAEDQGGGSSNYRYSFAVFSGGVEKTVIANTFGNIVTGVWNCIIVWWNASTQTLSISINDGGVDNFSVGADLGAVGTAQFRIGSRQFSGFENYWNGRIDAVHLWKRVLSPTERSEFYNSDNGIEFGGTLAPTARAGLDQVRMELETVMLDSSQSTSGVGIASRLWEQVSGTSVEILNATSVNPTFVAPDVAVDTNLVFKVTITDTESNTAEDQVIITIVPTGSTTWRWNVPQEQGLDPDEFYSSLLFLPDKSMVIRNGRVIGTRGDVTTEGLTWSASKSLVALIFARQLQLANVAYTDTVPLTGSPLATYEQMMAMVGDYNLTPHSPGDHYAYNNLAVHHYGTHLKDTFYAGNTHVQALQNAFVTALDFEDTLGYNTSGLMSGWDGGWSMSTRDLARICQLILQNGLWEGTQILDSDFIDRLYTCQVPDAATQSTDEGDIQTNELVLTVHLHGAYSFGFWLAQNHDFIGPPTMNEAISMIGAFGTTAHISRAKQLIVVACNVGGTTTNDSTVAIPGSVFDLFANAIPEQRASSRLFRASLHAFFDDEELNRTEFLQPEEFTGVLGAVAINSTASITITARVIKNRIATIAASASVSISGQIAPQAQRSSSRLFRGSLHEFFDDESLNRTEFWDVREVVDHDRAASIAAIASVTVAREFFSVLERSVQQSAAAAISVAAQSFSVIERGVSVSVTASVQASSQFFSVVQRSTAIQATASITIAAQHFTTVQRSVTIGVQSSLVASGQFFSTLNTSVVIAGQGVISVSVAVFDEVERSASLSATVAIQVSGTRIVSRAVSIASSTAITVSAQRDLHRSVALNGSAGISTAAQFLSVFNRAATLNSTATITTTHQRELMRPVAIGALSTITARGEGVAEELERSAQLNATASINVSSHRIVERSVSFALSASISANAQSFSIIESSVQFQAVGLIGIVALIAHQRSVALSAVSDILTNAQFYSTLERAVELNTIAAISATVGKYERSVQMGATGNISVSGFIAVTILHPTAISLADDGQLSAMISNGTNGVSITSGEVQVVLNG